MPWSLVTPADVLLRWDGLRATCVDTTVAVDTFGVLASDARKLIFRLARAPERSKG